MAKYFNENKNKPISSPAFVIPPPAGSSSGDMLASTYDPTGVEADAFSMGNMIETSTKKILSDTERSAISANTSALSGKEDVANKDTDSAFTANSDTKYPSQKAVKTALDLKAPKASPVFTGDAGFGATPAFARLDVVKGSNNSIALIDDRSMAINQGGGVLFGGNYTGTTPTSWARITGLKENGTDSNYAGKFVIETRPNGGSLTERVSVGSDGVFSLVSGQLKFPATQNPSADPNTLDDYEEGTFTPKIQDASFSDAEGQTYSAQVGRYVKIGSWVLFKLHLDALGLGTISGSLNLAGLPFTSLSSSLTLSSIFFGFGASLGLTAGVQPAGYIGPNTDYISLQKWSASGGTTDLTDTDTTGAFAITLSGFYSI